VLNKVPLHKHTYIMAQNPTSRLHDVHNNGVDAVDNDMYAGHNT